jgi:ATP-binding cassette subfamily F protein 3
MINFSNVTLRRGQHVLLQQVNWTIYHKQRIGMIGSNGSGKTSFFSMVLGQLQPDVGDITIPKQLKIAYVEQETPATQQTALDFVLDGDEELRMLEQDLNKAYDDNDGDKIATLHEKMSIIDAYTATARAAQLLAGLGFNQEQQQQTVGEFSGGWRIRLNLAKALMCRSDMLLLDEPTNHLDLDAVLWLEQWILKYPGTLLMISHDRDFLDHTVDHIAYIAHQELKAYTGNYSTFEKNRAAELLMQQATFEKQQRQLSHLQGFVDRFRASAAKARQAQSRLKAIERMDLVCAVQTESEFQFSFREPTSCPNPLIYIDEAKISYGEKNVLSHLNLSIAPKERIAILGPNGAGKSSLIKLLAGELLQSEGKRTASSTLKIGYFAQHQVDQLLINESPFDHMRDLSPKTAEQDIRKYLGSFGFSGDTVFEPIKHFSGGEKSRLALALLVWQQPNLLLLDEPTNHLDLEMRNALSIALQEYEGSMILVSHDRFLVRTTTDKLMLVADGKLENYEGDLLDYEKWLLEYRKQQAKAGAAPVIKSDISKKEQRQIDAKQRELRRPILQKIEKLEKELRTLEKKNDALETVLADLTLYEPNNKDTLQKHLGDQAKLKKELERVELEWLQLCTERDSLI